MLLKYSVSNYKSIGHTVEFSMIPTDENTDERFITTLKTNFGDIKVLRRGGFFGPNAAGKSTFIRSIKFAHDYIVLGQISGKNTGVTQFKGHFEDLNEETVFQFVFYLDGEIYEYGFSLNSSSVTEEWLMIRTDNEKFEEIFTRTTDANAKTDIDIGNKIVIDDVKDKLLAELLCASIKENQKNQLFLFKLKENGIKRAERVFEWFMNIQFIFPNSKLQRLPIKIKKYGNLKKFLSETLKRLDTGVLDISVSDKKIHFMEFSKKNNLSYDVTEHIENNRNGLIKIGGKYFLFFERDNEIYLSQLKFSHRLNNREVEFNIDEESDGTQRLMDLLPILFMMNDKNTILYFVDEIDRSLHTKLSKYILKTFVENSDNLLKQIIFTAHDVNLIDLQDFSKEEIWFVEKSNKGESILKPFSDFSTAKGQNIMKDYLNGRFGAIPQIRGDD